MIKNDVELKYMNQAGSGFSTFSQNQMTPSIPIPQPPPYRGYHSQNPWIKQYPSEWEKPAQYPIEGYPTKYQGMGRESQFEKEKQKSSLLDYFGIFPTIPTVNLIKIFALITLIALVELNMLMNLGAEKIIGNLDIPKSSVLFGVSLIGLFLALVYRYTEFEYEQMLREQNLVGKANIKTVIKIFFLIFLIIFIFIEVIIELINARGFLFAIDMVSILTLLFGTYTVLSGKRYFNIFTIILVFLTMLLGIDYQPNIPIMLFLGFLTILYIELSDGACRLQEFIQKYHELNEELKMEKKIELDGHLDSLSIQFIQNLGLFLALTIIITGIFSGIFLYYTYLTPEFMSENLEFHSIYTIIPVIILLFMIFIIIYLITPQTPQQINPQQKSINNTPNQ